MTRLEGPRTDAPREGESDGWEMMTIKRVLIVDDSPTERHVLNDMLTKAGYEFVASDNVVDSILKEPRPSSLT